MKKLKFIFFFITIVFYSCQKGNNNSQPQVNSIAIGAFYQGGYIFYVDNTGSHGLICAPINQGEAIWGCVNSSVTGTSKSIGTGLQNTINIVTQCNSPNKAADTCLNLALNGYNDWYLPSIDELQLIYINLKSNGIGNFSAGGGYWSSTQYGIPSGWTQYASYYMGFNNAQQSYLTYREAKCRVRAIRSF